MSDRSRLLLSTSWSLQELRVVTIVVISASFDPLPIIGFAYSKGASDNYAR